MKKLFLLLTVAFYTHALSAQSAGSSNKGKVSMDESAVPADARTNFRAENPNEDVTWMMDGKNYKADYADDSNASHARIYDNSGKLIWRDDEVNSYPTPISDYYTKNFPGEGYMVWSRIDNNGVTMYYIFRNSETIWFDKSGSLINPKKDKSKTNAGNIKMK